MTTDRQERTRIAAGLLECDPKTVLPRVQAMPPLERQALKRRIDDVIEWVADYDAAEARAKAAGGNG